MAYRNVDDGFPSVNTMALSRPAQSVVQKADQSFFLYKLDKHTYDDARVVYGEKKLPGPYRHGRAGLTIRFDGGVDAFGEVYLDDVRVQPIYMPRQLDLLLPDTIYVERKSGEYFIMQKDVWESHRLTGGFAQKARRLLSSITKRKQPVRRNAKGQFST